MKKLIIIVIITAFSCQKEIEMDVETLKTKMVLNSIFSNADIINVKLTESKTILQNNNSEVNQINNATISLWNNNILIGYFTNHSNGKYDLINHIPENEKLYEIKVEHPNFTNISSRSSCPKAVNILNIDTLTMGNQLILGIKVNNITQEENYYSIQVLSTYIEALEIEPNIFINDTVEYIDWLCSNDVNIDINGEFCSDNLLFNDKNCTGNSHTFNILKTVYPNMISLKIVVKSLSQDLFKHQQSLQIYQHNLNNPISEPVQVYSNIKNGMGIFGGYSESSDTIYF